MTDHCRRKSLHAYARHPRNDSSTSLPVNINLVRYFRGTIYESYSGSDRASIQFASSDHAEDSFRSPIVW